MAFLFFMSMLVLIPSFLFHLFFNDGRRFWARTHHDGVHRITIALSLSS